MSILRNLRKYLPIGTKKSGFTIVELLVVIVVIGILASITVVAYSGIQLQSRLAKTSSDLGELSKAIVVARSLENKTLIGITGSVYTASTCISKVSGTDLAALAKTDNCWLAYLSALDKISIASNINVRNIVDPWGRPYFIDENEGEGGVSCSQDTLSVYGYPYTANTSNSLGLVRPPLTGYTGCAI